MSYCKTVIKQPVNDKISLLLSEVIKTSTVAKTDYKPMSVEEFIRVPVPSFDTEKGSTTFKFLEGYKPKYLVAAGKLLNATRITNAMYYPPFSCMEWHTNSDLEGTRHYYTYTESEAIFKYVDSLGNIIIDYDNTGWTHRKFKITKEDPLWHSVWTSGPRYSFGFMTND